VGEKRGEGGNGFPLPSLSRRRRGGEGYTETQLKKKGERGPSLSWDSGLMADNLKRMSLRAKKKAGTDSCCPDTSRGRKKKKRRGLVSIGAGQKE